ncbi:MAG: hypothetical protein ACKODX_04090, partial [Gemmata sp.]
RADHTWRAIDPRGFAPYPHVTVSDADRARCCARARDSYHAALGDLRVCPPAERAYRELVAGCRALGVPVAFFVTPESATFRGWYAPASRAELARFLAVLRDGWGCPVFEAPASCAEEDFVDGHHMLRPAAAKYSRALADEHLRPWLAGALK